jgi:hypothetical protein
MRSRAKVGWLSFSGLPFDLILAHANTLIVIERPRWLCLSKGQPSPPRRRAHQVYRDEERRSPRFWAAWSELWPLLMYPA